MKLSLAWIFDHIQANLDDVDVASLLQQLSDKTAEIESFRRLDIPLENLALAYVTSADAHGVHVQCPEWKLTTTLPERADIMPEQWYLINRLTGQVGWAHLSALGAEKDGLIPALACDPDEAHDGRWRAPLRSADWILEVSSTAITHRPDLWGARGFAREIAAIMGWRLHNLDDLVQDMPLHEAQTEFHANKAFPFAIKNSAPSACSRFAVLHAHGIKNTATPLWLAARLARVDQRPINRVVDIANYVMLDLGQPLHTFDANAVASKTLEPRMAVAGQQLELLDGQTIQLTEYDLVISDGAHPLALAGIMGGVGTGASQETHAILVEAAHFDPGHIRKTCVRYRLRTDASARFEKDIDPNHNTSALMRFARLLESTGDAEITDCIVSLGQPAPDRTITVSLAYIRQRLGVDIGPQDVVDSLLRLGFGVDQPAHKDQIIYRVTVPSIRGHAALTQDVDIVEEVARMYGLGRISPAPVLWAMAPCDNTRTFVTREIKDTIAFAARMREVINYPFFDEDFLRTIAYNPKDAVPAKNPLSANVTRLVTSLIPHLIKNVQTNCHKADQLRLFECGRVWRMGPDGTPAEASAIAGIWWHNNNTCSFYTGKDLLQPLFDRLGMQVMWQRAQADEPWQDANQIAHIMHNNIPVGRAYMIDQAFWGHVATGNAFAFELDGQYLTTYRRPTTAMAPLPKFPHTWLDISMLLPTSKTVDEVMNVITACDARIWQIELRDIFEKEEWHDSRAVTVRLFARDPERTLDKRDLDEIMAKAQSTVERLGAQVR